MISFKSPGRCLALGIAFAAFSAVHAQSVDPSLYAGLRWRNIGPMRAGRVSAVSGAIGQPGTFYMGLPGGGVWKTTSAGVTWFPIFDDIKSSSSVGAVQVAPSDPNVIYVGMGDMTAGGAIAEGDGMYKSTDAGKTWTHIGLETSKQIPSIYVDPHNPDLVLVAAQGFRFSKNQDRGVYRSTDGGKTWTKTLYVDDITGMERLAAAYDHPETILAVSTRHFSDVNARPGGGGGAPPSSTHLFKSTDEGLTWTEIKGNGLPNLSGRTCVAVANGSDAKRMFIVGNFGLYRSDDGGANWRQMDKEDDRVRNGQGGYNCGVYVNPKNPDIVYVINTCTYRSTDGGETFSAWKGAPGGDDPQQMWLDPTDGNRIFLGMDQGATVTFDGGGTWSSWYNQPSGQLYHIAVDNQFPYWVYGTEQDSGCIGVSSRGNLGAITPLDWLPHPGFEFGYIAVDPKDPRVSYSGGPGLGVVKVSYPTGQSITVGPSLDSSLKLRQTIDQPIVFNPTNPKELLVGFQYLMSSTDGGATWKKLSPDLGFPKGEEPKKEGEDKKKTANGNFATEVEVDSGDIPEGDEEEMELQRFGGRGGSIQTVSVSVVAPSTIWVGTTNGLIKKTTDRGKDWDDVSIAGLPARANITSLEASHFDPQTAYAAVGCNGIGDYKPHFYRTRDGGKSWQEIVNGLPTDQPSGSFARVLREDTERKGLLFAGTESSMYVSFDDGDNWQSLALNLPNTSYRDLVVKGDDLVACTYGRGIWILDQLTPLREVTPAIASQSAHLFKPGDTYRVRRNVNGDTPYPPEVPTAPNAPDGAMIYYYLGDKPSGEITLDVTDSAGHHVRRLTSAPAPTFNEPAPAVPDLWKWTPAPMSTAPGMSRINWDLRYDNPQTFEHTYEMNANPGRTPISPEGPLVPPGRYKLTLNVDGKTYEQFLTVKNDPRSPASTKDLVAQSELQRRLYDGIQDAYAGHLQVAQMRAQIAELLAANPPTEVADAAKAFDNKLAALAGNGKPLRIVVGLGFSGDNESPNFADVNRSLVDQLKLMDTGDMAPNGPMRSGCDALCDSLNTAEWNWKQLNAKDLADLNTLLTKNNLKPIPAAAGIGNPKAPAIKKEKKKES